MDILLSPGAAAPVGTVRIIPPDSPLAACVREILSPRFSSSGALCALTVICGGDIAPPPRGAVIVLSDRDEDCGRVVYLPRPIDFCRLLATAQRLCESVEAPVVGAGAYRISLAARTVSLGECEAVLTEKEFALFSMLYAAGGALVSKDEVCRALWSGKRSNACDVCVCYLRRKLEALSGPGALISVRGKGYILCTPAMPESSERNQKN